MIDWNKSAEINTCSVDELKARFKRFPKSNKRIVAICDKCGNAREIYNHAYHSLCGSCGNSMHNPETVAKVAKSRRNNPDIAKNISIGLKKYHDDHPDVAKEISERVKKLWKDHPETYDTESFKNMVSDFVSAAYKRSKDPEYLKIASDRMKDLWKHHPETYNTPSCIKARDSNVLSTRATEWHKNHPEWKIEHSARMQGIPIDEWDGFTDKSRPHLVPKTQCIHLNCVMDGCAQHHITSGVIINMPTYLHKSVRHRLTTDAREGNNMEIINELAFRYLLSGDF